MTLLDFYRIAQTHFQTIADLCPSNDPDAFSQENCVQETQKLGELIRWELDALEGALMQVTQNDTRIP